ncbi:MAG: ABC transporter ATP-binding protein [Acidobacteriota bacterium]
MKEVRQLVLEIRGLKKAFPGHLSVGRTPVLTGVDLSVKEGEIYGFLGVNGAGKTTTLKIVAGLIHADRGAVFIHGRPATDPAARRLMGFLPEQPSFYDHLNAAEFLDLHGRLLGLPDRRLHVQRILERVGMAERAGIPIRKCSKGMLQRIGIGQAIMGEPRLLILDEPLSGLDPAGRRDLRDIILEQCRQGATVFFSSHILSDAELICDRVGVLHGGRLILEGRLQDLLAREIPAWEVSMRTPGSLPELQGVTVVSRQGDRAFLQVTGERELTAFLDWLSAAGGHLLSLVPSRHSLEERFLDLVGREKGGS